MSLNRRYLVEASTFEIISGDTPVDPIEIDGLLDPLPVWKGCGARAASDHDQIIWIGTAAGRERITNAKRTYVRVHPRRFSLHEMIDGQLVQRVKDSILFQLEQHLLGDLPTVKWT